MALLGSSRGATAQAPPAEAQVKAAFLYNFAKFVEWPKEAALRPRFTLCVLGSDPFGQDLDDLVAGRTVRGLAFDVRRLDSAREAARSCRVVYVAPSEVGRLDELLDVLVPAGVLAVTDVPGGAARGAVINFVMQGTKVRFEVNLEASERAGLRISSELLRIARVVRPAGDGR